MRIFLGTGAAELFPCPFCTCKICTAARAAGIAKKRSAFLLNDETLVDIGPDVMASVQQYGLNLSKLRRIFVTHSHADHFSIANLCVLTMSTQKPEKPIDVYLSQEAFDWALQVIPFHEPGLPVVQKNATTALVAGLYTFHAIRAGEAFAADELQVLPIPTVHHAYGENETALSYLFTMPNGETLLYACDTGMYGEQALELLRGHHLDTMIMECTFGSKALPENSGHMNAERFILQMQRLQAVGALNKASKIYSTHLNPKHEFLPDDLEKFLCANAPYPVTVAYDGMILEEK